MKTLNRKTIKAEILAAIGTSNLVTYADSLQQVNYLRIQISEDGQSADVTLGNAPGNAYVCAKNELFIPAGVEFTGYQQDLEDAGFWYDEVSDEFVAGDECAYSSQEEAEEEFDANVTAYHIESNMESWLDMCESAFKAE